MYSEDSYFTLTPTGQIGLAILSGLLFLLVSAAVWRLTSSHSPFTRVAIAFVAFWLFVWLSPQVYYAYYRLIIDGLPRQWVIGWPPFGDAVRYLTFTGYPTLSAHAQGLMGWAMISLALLRRRNVLT